MQHYSDQVKAQVIVEWQAWESLGAISARHGVPRSTIQEWIKGRSRTAAVQKNKAQLDDLVYDLARETVLGLTAIARKAQDPVWLDKQEANGLHLLFGVGADKVIRLYEAINPDRLREIEERRALVPGSAGPQGE